MSIKQEIEKTYRKFDKIFTNQLGKPLKEFKISQIRDQFKVWISQENPLFLDVSQAEDAFLYIYHFIELQEIKRHAIYLREMNDEPKYSRFIQNSLMKILLQVYKISKCIRSTMSLTKYGFLEKTTPTY